MRVGKPRYRLLNHPVVELGADRLITLRLHLRDVSLHFCDLLDFLLLILLNIFLYLFSNFLQLLLLNFIVFFLEIQLLLLSFADFFQILVKEVAAVLLIRPLLKEYLLGRPKRPIILPYELIKRFIWYELILRDATQGLIHFADFL